MMFKELKEKKEAAPIKMFLQRKERKLKTTKTLLGGGGGS
jgi:hypothetical protein